MLSAVVPGGRLPLRLPTFAGNSGRPGSAGGSKAAEVSRVFESVLRGRGAVPLAVVLLVAAQHAYLVLLLDASYHQHLALELMKRMPVRFISSAGTNHLPPGYGDKFAMLAAVESLALLALYRGLAKPTAEKIALVGCGMLLACADAVVSRAGTSADMYSYVGYTLLGARAYAPPAQAFAGAYSAINAWWQTPMVAAPYGPVWLAIASLAATCGHTLLAKIVALRVLGALTLAGTVGALVALKLPIRVVALVALNPALIFEFVANVHNDLFGVMLLLLARYAASRGTTWLAIALAVTAGLVKLPFVLFAAFAFTPLPSRARRLRAFGLAAAAAAAASLWIGGAAYVAALRAHVDQSTYGHLAVALSGLPVILKASALAAVLAALLGGIFAEGFAWALPAVGATLYPWYLGWTLPYAVASDTALRNVAIALPVAMLLTDRDLESGPIAVVLLTATYCWLAASLALVLTKRFARRAAA